MELDPKDVFGDAAPLWERWAELLRERKAAEVQWVLCKANRIHTTIHSNVIRVEITDPGTLRDAGKRIVDLDIQLDLTRRALAQSLSKFRR